MHGRADIQAGKNHCSMHRPATMYVFASIHSDFYHIHICSYIHLPRFSPERSTRPLPPFHLLSATDHWINQDFKRAKNLTRKLDQQCSVVLLVISSAGLFVL